MAIKSLKTLNVLGFKRQWRINNGFVENAKAGDTIADAFELDFCDGINILIGENGVGKTSILKMLYAATQWSVEKTDQGKTKQLIQFFSNNLSDMDLIRNQDRKEDYAFFEVSDGKHKFNYSIPHKGILNFDEWLGLNISSVYIPAGEMLSHSKGFLALNSKYKLPFDGTQIDIIVNASLPEARKVPKYMEKVLSLISDAIDGEVMQEDDVFYVIKRDGRKIDFSLEAEGLRKLGLLWKLIRNGLLESGSILLWDEPESNLNPQLFPLVAEILLELERNGVQIFVATHSYNLAKYFELRRTDVAQVMYHSLYKASGELPKNISGLPVINENSDEIYSNSALNLKDIVKNSMIVADEDLLDEAFDKYMVD